MVKLGTVLGALLFVLPACSSDSGSSANTKSSLASTSNIVNPGPALGTGGPVASTPKKKSMFASTPKCGEEELTEDQYECSSAEEQAPVQAGPSLTQRQLLKNLSDRAHEDWVQVKLTSNNGTTVRMLSSDCETGENELSSYVYDVSEQLRGGHFVAVECVTDGSTIFSVTL